MACAVFRPGSAKWLNGRLACDAPVLTENPLAGRAHAPIAERRLHQSQRGDARSIRTQDAGAEREPQDFRLAQQHGAFLVGKAALGSDQDVDPVSSLSPLERLQRVGHVGRLVTKDEKALRLSAAQKAVE